MSPPVRVSPAHTRSGTSYNLIMSDTENSENEARRDDLNRQVTELGAKVERLLGLIEATQLRPLETASPPNQPGTPSNTSGLIEGIREVNDVSHGSVEQSSLNSTAPDPSSNVLPARKQLSRQDIDANFLAFSRQNPSTWFSITEERFEYLNISSDEDKYWIILKCLGPAFFDELQAFMPSLRSGHKYPALKAEILRKLAQSEDHKLDRLLLESQMGKRTPSEYFNIVQNLSAGIMSPDAALRFWWKGLPTDIAIGIDPEIHKLDSLAAVEKANRIAELKRSKESSQLHSSIASVGTNPVPLEDSPKVLARLEALEKRESFLKKTPSKLKQGKRTRPRSRSRDKWLCFYHFKHGDKARFCLEPCAWKKKHTDMPSSSDSPPPTKNELKNE